MIRCPIAEWSKSVPYKLAFDTLTYAQLHTLVNQLTAAVSAYPEPIIAFIPKQTPLDIALFFAIWRLGKIAYPLNARQPRLKIPSAALVNPAEFSLHHQIEINELDEKALATLIETSGTTQDPKIVCHTLNSHLISAQSAIKALDINTHDRYCLNLPLYHISGLALTLRTLLSGATIITDLAAATHLSMVPTQLYRYLQNPYPLPYLKSLLIGGAPLSPLLYTQAQNADLPIHLSYGMTETSSLALLDGTPLPHIEMQISSEQEILLRGPSLLKRYWNQPDQTGWFATRDLGRVTSSGRIEIIGRKDRMFISGGENIHPEEIERAFLQIEGVISAQVTPKADEEFGMVPEAILTTNKNINTAILRKRLEEFLPKFKIPKHINFNYVLK